MPRETLPRAASAVHLLALAVGVSARLGARVQPGFALQAEPRKVLDYKPRWASKEEVWDFKPPPTVAPIPSALRNGLVFIRVPKVGSSTFGGVMRRIGYRRGLTHTHDSMWLGVEPEEEKTPAMFGQHAARTDIAEVLAERMPGAFFVTLVREPAARCLSNFYFKEVSRKRTEPTEANKLRFMHRICRPDTQFNWTRPTLDSSLSSVMAGYDLVAVTERIDESLLVLAKRIGVGMTDLLYVPEKVAGWSENHTTGRRLAGHPPLDDEPKAVQEAAKRILGGGLDEQLHKAANVALDEAIAKYGPGFREDLAEFQRRLGVVAADCHTPWTRDCFYRNIGCNQACIDTCAANNQWG